MSYSINRVVLVGRLTHDPELRALASGANVCSLRIACNSVRRAPDGELTERPNFFDVSVYGAPADSVSQYMHRGSRVGIDGRLEWREWETSEQQRRQAVSIVADTVQFLDSPGERANVDAHADSALDHGDGRQAGEDDRELVGVGADGEDDVAF
jgi:single-strand DNA-binding protein